MIISRDLLNLPVNLGKPCVIRESRVIEGSEVVFINGVAAPACKSCGKPFRFDLQFRKVELDVPPEDAAAKIIEAIERQHERA